ncbi:helix-turn-helix domain-containing protein [Gorillibacterium timonense]|uniref:helix-turn-helix domain-containing protein n=1 Tax=Gorillibacterium timonense TaxID=1689269 RepID=UPI00071D1D24|nr:helix-turn-helix domain-containing protein [Gorillibacterium timonense]
MNKVMLEWFTTDDQFPFFIQYGGHKEDADLHVHLDFSELVIVLNGTATHLINAEETFIKKGDVFVINGSTPHGYKDARDFKICNIMYRTHMLSSMKTDLNHSSGFQALFVIEPFYRQEQPFMSRLSLDIAKLEYVLGLISHLIEEYINKRQAYQTMVGAYFMQLIVYLSRLYENQDDRRQDHLLHLAKAISYLEDHYLEPLTMEELAARSQLSVRHLNRMFRLHYNITPLAYIQKLRFERACVLLKKTKLPITDVSYECGFNDSNYFTRQFTKTLGVSPTRYRLGSV